MKKITFLVLYSFIFFSCQEENIDDVAPIITNFVIEEHKNINAELFENKVTLVLPYGSSKKSLKPNITFSGAINIIPGSGVPQDFTKKVYYTLTSKNNRKYVFEVDIKEGPQPNPVITSLEKDTIEAGLSTLISGKNFGTFSPAVSLSLVNESLESISLPFSLLDSNKIQINVPIDTKDGKYKVKVKVNMLETISEKSIHISYPTPQILGLNKENIINDDTLWISAKYIDPKYAYSIIFKSNLKQIEIPASLRSTGKIGLVPKELVGEFDIFLSNINLGKTSISKQFKLTLYDSKLPYVESIVVYKITYKKGDNITFSTKNFEQSSPRFFQVSLIGPEKTYIQNGLFSNKKLSLDLPSDILNGNYALSFLLTDPASAYSYSFKSDLKINVKD